MKDSFSDQIEDIIGYSNELFSIFSLDNFGLLTVEPVPGMLNIPKKLLNDEFIEVVNTHILYHIVRISKRHKDRKNDL